MDVYLLLFAAISILAGLFMVTAKDALPSAMGLLTVFVSLAALYLHLHAPLVAIFQVTIYAGAILVLIVFVIMLLMSPGDEMQEYQPNVAFRGLGAILSLIMLGLVAVAIRGISDVVQAMKLPEGFGHPGQFGDLMFKDFLLHFEVVSILLLVALVGAIYIAKRDVK